MGAVVVKRLLMIAYHFPPHNVSSGIQRTLRFAQYLPDFGWEPVVLTAHTRAYGGRAAAALGEVPAAVDVRRAFALDTARHLAVRGRYSRLLCIPDRWCSWWLGAVPAGLALIRRHKPDVLWTTYPIATAHLIGHTLHRLTGIPWVADFRDPMAQEGYPADPLQHRAFRWIERETLRQCERAVFTASGALRLYAERYPDIPSSRLAIIENGYDESSFEDKQAAAPRDAAQRELVLVHSGTVYPSERDPRPLLRALSRLRESGRLARHALRVVLRATGCDDYLRELVTRHGLEDMVKLEPALPYRAALAEMMSSDGLLVLQAANCNYQVPAKVYEYLRAQRPVLALTDPAGDTAGVLRAAGIDTIAPLDDENAIADALVSFVAMMRENRAPVAGAAQVEGASRRRRTGELAGVLAGVLGDAEKKTRAA